MKNLAENWNQRRQIWIFILEFICNMGYQNHQNLMLNSNMMSKGSHFEFSWRPFWIFIFSTNLLMVWYGVSPWWPWLTTFIFTTWVPDIKSYFHKKFGVQPPIFDRLTWWYGQTNDVFFFKKVHLSLHFSQVWFKLGQSCIIEGRCSISIPTTRKRKQFNRLSEKNLTPFLIRICRKNHMFLQNVH